MIMGLTWKLIPTGHVTLALDSSSKLVVPAACQNGAETTDIERLPDDEETGPDQGSSSWPQDSKRPPTDL
jgi:hypothetical protein